MSYAAAIHIVYTALKSHDSSVDEWGGLQFCCLYKILSEESPLCYERRTYVTLCLFWQGVTQGYLRYLRIQGIGYRAALQEQTLTFKLGYSHDITYTLPTSLRAFLPEPTLVGIYGIDKTQVSHASVGSVCILTRHGAGGVRPGWLKSCSFDFAVYECWEAASLR